MRLPDARRVYPNHGAVTPPTVLVRLGERSEGDNSGGGHESDTTDGCPEKQGVDPGPGAC